jgi:MFS family permease
VTSSSDAVAPIASITVVAVVTALAQTAVWAVRPMVSYRALDLGATPFDLGVVGGAFSVLSLFFAVPAGRWVDRRGEVTAIAAGAAMVAATCAALVPARSLAALIVCHAVLGVASIVNVVGLQAIVANRATVAQRDRRFATFTMAVSFGQLLGPAVAGLIATKVASAGGFLSVRLLRHWPPPSLRRCCRGDRRIRPFHPVGRVLLGRDFSR